MQTGPSKKILAEYFKNNRQYFDSIASQYKETDPEYYNTHIAPFYNNPFYASTSSKKGGCAVRSLFMVSMLILIAGVAAVSLFLSKEKAEKELDKAIDKEIQKSVEQIQSDEVNPENLKESLKPSDILDTLTSVRSMNDYQKGVMYFKIGEFDKAEVYFSQVKRDDPGFPDARKKLSEIRKLRIENSIEQDKPARNSRK